MKEIKCIKCNGDAQELYLDSQYHISLTDKQHFLSVIPRNNTKQITKNGEGFGFKAPSIKVCYCDHCQLVWFHLDEPFNNNLS